jgi:membrane-bound lytic murein transglycosylase B
VIELDRRQPEFMQSFRDYLDKRVTPERVERGRALLKKHRDLLTQVRDTYGVQPHYLVAFWGLESNFGDYLGGFPVIGSLATLAYDERRSAFFRRQLLHALHIVDEGHVAAQRMKGSWAGAMGHMQFIPSTFVRYAVDADGDGRRDIWHTLPDVFASAANYLSSIGWRGDERWGREVRLPDGFDYTLSGLETRRSLAEWHALGVRRADGGRLPRADMEGSVVLPAGHEGPAFLVYRNFRAILAWNRSLSYAVAVGHLADRIVGRGRLAAPRVEQTPLSRQDVEELQRLLVGLGFDAGTPDGIAGPQTRSAVQAYQAKAGMPADGYPSRTVLRSLRRRAERAEGQG